MMYKLAAAFRKQLATHATEHRWRVTKSSANRFTAECRTAEGTFFELSVAPQCVWVSDVQPLLPAASCWSYVVFEALENRISEILSASGHDPSLTDRRSAKFPLSKLLRPGDPDCLTGYILWPELSPTEQASDFWSFYWSRAELAFARLRSPEVLADPRYHPPFASQTAWSTRQMLWYALRGNFATAHRMALSIEKFARSDLVSSVRALQTSAVSKGHDFLPSPGATDYTTHPRWLEFVAIREHISKIS
jgi:hypothetical protein